MNDQGNPVLYAIVTGSPVAGDVGKLVGFAQGDGWDVCVVTSPDGRKFIDVDALEALTGHPVRSSYKDPDVPDVLPPADAMIAAPITCNSLAKWAVGISDTLPLGLLVEAVGKRLPVVAAPYSNDAQLGFPPIRDAMRKLSEWGVTVLAGDDVRTSHKPGTGAGQRDSFPWNQVWRAVLDHPWLRLP